MGNNIITFCYRRWCFSNINRFRWSNQFSRTLCSWVLRGHTPKHLYSHCYLIDPCSGIYSHKLSLKWVDEVYFNRSGWVMTSLEYLNKSATITTDYVLQTFIFSYELFQSMKEKQCINLFFLGPRSKNLVKSNSIQTVDNCEWCDIGTVIAGTFNTNSIDWSDCSQVNLDVLVAVNLSSCPSILYK